MTFDELSRAQSGNGQRLGIVSRFFEPIIIHHPTHIAHYILAVIIGAGAHTLISMSPFQSIRISTQPVSLTVLTGVAAGLAYIAAIKWIYSAYWRIYPGRADILKFALLRSRARLIDTLDLSEVSIVYDDDLKRIGFLRPGDVHGAGGWIEMSCSKVLAHAIFRGAVSPPVDINLPGESLLG